MYIGKINTVSETICIETISNLDKNRGKQETRLSQVNWGLNENAFNLSLIESFRFG